MSPERHAYGLIIAPSVRRALADSLPPTAAFAAWEFIRGPLTADSRRVGAPLRAPFVGQWRARRGEYRVRYEIDESIHLVRVLDVEHRRDAYRT